MITLLLAAAMASPLQVQVGDSTHVPVWTWVTVKNSAPVRSGNNSFGYNDTCGIQHGATMTVEGIAGEQILVSYQIETVQYGTPCPSGVIFFISREDFLRAEDLYQSILNEAQKEKELIQRLLEERGK